MRRTLRYRAGAGLLAAATALLPTLAAAQQPSTPPTPPATAPADPTSGTQPPVPMAPPNTPADAPTADYRDPDSGVEIYTGVDADMFPLSWRTPDVAAAALPLAPADRDRAVRLMRVALSKYPADILRENLQRIYVVSDLRFAGIDAAGTNSKDRLYIKLDTSNPAYTDSFVEDSVHHEFGHMLQRNFEYLWDAAAWARLNPPDFHYGKGEAGLQAAREGHSSLRVTEGWNRRGFMSEYAATDASEDFATIAGALFVSQPAFWLGLERYPVLQDKIEFVVAFYGKLDPTFTDTYFHGLRPGLAYVAPPLPANPTSATTPSATPPTVTPTTPATPATPTPPSSPTTPPADPPVNPPTNPTTPPAAP